MKTELVFLAVLLACISGLFGYLIVLLYRYAFRKGVHNERAHHPLDAKFIAEISPSEARQLAKDLNNAHVAVSHDSSPQNPRSEDYPAQKTEVQKLEPHPFDDDVQDSVPEYSHSRYKRNKKSTATGNDPRNNLARHRLKEKLRAKTCTLASNVEVGNHLENEYTD